MIDCNVIAANDCVAMANNGNYGIASVTKESYRVSLRLLTLQPTHYPLVYFISLSSAEVIGSNDLILVLG